MGEYWQRVWDYDDEWFLVRRISGKKPVLYKCRQRECDRAPKRYSLKHDDIERGRQDLIRWREAEIRHVEGTGDVVTIRYCLSRYWNAHGKDLPSAHQIDTASRQILAVVNNEPVVHLRDHDNVVALRDALRRSGNGKTNGGINRCLEVLISALHWCWKKGELESVPFIEKLPASPARDRVATVAELARIWDAIELDHLRTFFVLALGTGARSGAILELTRSQCDVSKRRIELNPKGRIQNDKRRPMIRMAESVVPYIVAVQSGPIVNLDGQPVTSNKKAFARACERAGCSDITRHTLRHTVATWLREQDVPESECAAFLGHKWSNDTTNRYAHHRPDYQQRATAAVDALISEIGRVAPRPISGLFRYPADKLQTNLPPTFFKGLRNP